jgi:hypothetical protein
MNHLYRWALRPLVAASLIAISISTTSAHAGVLTFTDPSQFGAALAGLNSNTQDFEGFPSGGVAASGSIFGGISYTVAAGLDLRIDSIFSTTSGSNYLGLDTPDGAFASGDSLSLAMIGSYRAIGLYIIGSPGDMRLHDVTLTAAGVSVSNDATPNQLLGDGGEAYFLGLVGTSSLDEFSNATLSSFGDPNNAFYLWNVDDVLTAQAGNVVPEPSSLALLLVALGMAGRRLSGRLLGPRGNSTLSLLGGKPCSFGHDPAAWERPLPGGRMPMTAFRQ